MRISNTTKALWAIALTGILFSPEGFKYTAYFATKATRSAVQMFTGSNAVVAEQAPIGTSDGGGYSYRDIATKKREILDQERKTWIKNHVDLPANTMDQLKAIASEREKTQPIPSSRNSLPQPVKPNTESITPLSREKLRFHEDIVRNLLN